jgi:4-hydroxy-tetrahydrodipicolinate synthase
VEFSWKMIRSFDARGAWTALVTPFTPTGAFDAGAFERLIAFQLAEGIDGLVPCGTTGESPTLTWEEHGAAVGLTVRMADGRVGVLAGTGSNNTGEAIDGTRDAWSRGANGALLVDCYYNGPSSLELRTEYYERVLAAVPDLPIVPYVIPGRTGCNLAAADLAILHLRDPRRVPAVKSATGDLARMREDRELAGPSLAILSGDDELTAPMMQDPAIRASGVISVISNIAPRATHELCQAATANDVERVKHLCRVLEPMFSSTTCKMRSERVLPNGRRVSVEDRFRNPVAVKTMMAGLGMLQPVFRAPLGLMTRAAVEHCRAALRAVHDLDPSVLRPIEAAFSVNIAERLASDDAWSALVR